GGAARRRSPVVGGEPGRRPAEPLRVETLERRAGAAVQLAAARGEKRRLGDVLRQRVVEGVPALVVRGALEEELEARELTEVGLEQVLAVPNGREERRRELAAQHRGGLEDALVLLLEPVDARAEDAVHGVRDWQACHQT